MKIRKTVSKILALVVLFVFPLIAFANELGSPSWEIKLIPYFWMTDLSGTTDVQGEKSKVDQSFFDILKKINMAFMLAVEARKDKWGIFLNPMYTSMRDDAKVGNVAVTLRNRMLAFDFGGFYRLAEWQTISDALQTNYLDLRFGGRYWHKHSAIDASVNNQGVFSTSMSTTWIDPLVGLHYNVCLTSKWMLNLSGDVGGGGFSKTSDITFDAFAGFGYSIDKDKSLIFGYRALYVSRKDDVDGVDMYSHTTMHGPIVAFELKF
ncbi:MAG: hypothetical protein WCW01_01480 [Gammaproteobacteria bacterium]